MGFDRENFSGGKRRRLTYPVFSLYYKLADDFRERGSDIVNTLMGRTRGGARGRGATHPDPSYQGRRAMLEGNVWKILNTQDILLRGFPTRGPTTKINGLF